MKGVAAAFSWIGGIITAVYLWIVFGIMASYELAFLIIPIVYTVLDLAILIWRQNAVENGYKVGCGVCTLIFCSLVGGILTLCIPESQLGGYSYSSSRKTYSSSSYTSSASITPLDRAAKITEYERQLRAGTISREEYDRKIAILDGKPYSSVSKPVQKTLSEDEKIELINKYKKLLDDGAITEEEYAKAKQKILG